MLGKSRWIRLVGLMVMLASLLTGCNTASGGGWIPSAEEEEGKATFGFNFHCKDTEGELGEPVAVVSGQLQYNDRPADVRFHGVVPTTPVPFAATCTEVTELLDEGGLDGFLELFFGAFGDDGATAFVGLARQQPSGEEGLFFVVAGDAGEPGENDAFCIGLLEELLVPLGFQPANNLIILPGQGDAYFNCGELGGGNIQVHSVE